MTILSTVIKGFVYIIGFGSMTYTGYSLASNILEKQEKISCGDFIVRWIMNLVSSLEKDSIEIIVNTFLKSSTIDVEYTSFGDQKELCKLVFRDNNGKNIFILSRTDTNQYYFNLINNVKGLSRTNLSKKDCTTYSAYKVCNTTISKALKS